MAVDWNALSDWLSRSGADRGVHQVYPPDSKRLSLIEATIDARIAASREELTTGSIISERLTALVAQAKSLDKLGSCPVVGITGLLNSGKSSLLSSYLSLEGRKRVLRGTANNQGTHRFVLWLPHVWWEQSELLELLCEYLRGMFGVRPERLADDPQEAYLQYNGHVLDESIWLTQSQASNRDPLMVPLITSDSGLDALGLALLDCPDIQTAWSVASDQFGDSETIALKTSTVDPQLVAARRRDHLSRVGRLCSAFLVVSKLNDLHDKNLLAIFETLRDTMPGVRRILAVNKVKARYGPEIVKQQAEDIVRRFEIADVYMAYDFRSHWADRRVPPAPPNFAMDADHPLPLFFRPVSEPVTNSRSAVLNDRSDSSDRDSGYVDLAPCKVDRYLHDLAGLLQPGTLMRETQQSVWRQIRSKSQEAVLWFENNQKLSANRLKHAWQAVSEACLSFMAERDSTNELVGLRLQTSPAIVTQMSDSLIRSAPWSMRPALALDRSVRQLQGAIAGGVKKWRWLQSATDSASQLISRFRRGQTGKVVTAMRFQEQLDRFDRHGTFSELPHETVQGLLENALNRFQQEDTVRLDQAWLDQWSSQVWQHMSLKKKLYVGMMPLAPVFGPLLAVTLIPFDGGGTAVLVFATTKELLIAAGLTALAVPTTMGGEVQDIIEGEAAFSQLCEMFAITCDSLGLPRPNAHEMPAIRLRGELRTLTKSELPLRVPATAKLLSTWAWAPGYVQQLDSVLSALGREFENERVA